MEEATASVLKRCDLSILMHGLIDDFEDLNRLQVIMESRFWAVENERKRTQEGLWRAREGALLRLGGQPKIPFPCVGGGSGRHKFPQ